MTGFTVCYVLAIFLMVGVEFALGFCSLRRNKGSIYAPVEKMYVERHGAGVPRHAAEEKSEDTRMCIICGQAAFFAFLTIVCIYGVFGESAVRLAESFTTIDQPFHKMVSFTASTLLLLFLLAVLFVGIRSLGRRARCCLLYREVDAYKEGEEDGKENVQVMHDVMQVMYAPTPKRLEAEATFVPETVEVTESFLEKQAWFEQRHNEVYYDPENVARRQKRDASVERSRNKLYETLNIDPQAKPLTPLEQLCQAFNIPTT